MPVEILVLSGARQGERHHLDGHRIVVGDVANADIALHPRDQAAACGRHATLDSSEQGWTLTNRGAGEWLVNQRPVSSGQSTRLRSGDVVRISDEGPDFRFAIVAAGAPSVAGPPVATETGTADEDAPTESAPRPDADGNRGQPRLARSAVIGGVGSLALVALLAFALSRLAHSDAPPRAVDDSASVEVGKPLHVAVLSNDQDERPQQLTVCRLDTSTTAGTATINPDGAIVYDTAGKFEQLQRGQSATDEFRYTLRDTGGQESQATVHIQVVRPADYNRPPRAGDDAAQVAGSGEAGLPVLGNDTDPDGDPLTVVRLVLEGTKGSATIGTGGAIQYRAAASADNASPGGAASDSFAYVVADGHGGEATARVTVTIAGVAGKRDGDVLVSRLANGIVYLIVEINGRKFPVCTGWALRPDLIVSTGAHLSVLEERHDSGDALFVGYGGAEPRFVPVEDVVVHPLFDKQASGSPLSRAHNVGVVTLKAPLPLHLDVTRAAALPKPPTGTKVTVLAYRLKAGAELQPFNILDPPGIVSVPGAVGGLETVAGSTNDLPLLLLDANPPAGSEGAAVLDEKGTVIGVMAGPSTNRYVVLCDQLDPLLPESK